MNSTTIKRLLTFILLSLTIFQSCQKTMNSKEVIHAMHQKYKDKWYKNVTFDQDAFFYKEDVMFKKQIWHEVIAIGEALAIKFDSLNAGSGYIFKNDSVYIFQDNKLINSEFRVHEVLEVGFNVYRQEVSKTIEKLELAGLDFSFYKEDANYHILGNPQEKQIWIEKDRLLFYKIENKMPDGSSSKIVFENYISLGEGWIAPEVLFFNNGRLTMKEVYFDIQIKSEIPAAAFELTNFAQNTW